MRACWSTKGLTVVWKPHAIDGKTINKVFSFQRKKPLSAQRPHAIKASTWNRISSVTCAHATIKLHRMRTKTVIVWTKQVECWLSSFRFMLHFNFWWSNNVERAHGKFAVAMKSNCQQVKALESFITEEPIRRHHLNLTYFTPSRDHNLRLKVLFHSTLTLQPEYIFSKWNF